MRVLLVDEPRSCREILADAFRVLRQHLEVITSVPEALEEVAPGCARTRWYAPSPPGYGVPPARGWMMGSWRGRQRHRRSRDPNPGLGDPSGVRRSER